MSAGSLAAFIVLLVVVAYLGAEMYVRRARARDAIRVRQVRRGKPAPWYEATTVDGRPDPRYTGFPWSSGPCR